MYEIIHFIVLIYSIIFHEVAHGFVAAVFGDDTAKRNRRLTLNPLPHIDIVGSILLPLFLITSGASFLIGWAKPVPVSIDRFRYPIRDMMWVSVAGPLTNITLAIVASIILKILFGFNLVGSTAVVYVFYVLVSIIQINLVLAVFNLIPIPPLDGSRILLYFLPKKWQFKWLQVEKYGFIIIFALVYFGAFSVLFRFLILPVLHFLISTS